VIRRALAITAAGAGLLAAISGSPYRAERATVDVAQLARAVAAEEDHVTALELAEWIREREPGLRVIDLRTLAEFQSYHLPRAEHIPLDALLTTPFRDSETIVLLSDGGAHAAQAWVFLRALGHRHVYFLRGGVGEWLDEVMNPTKPSDLTRYFGGAPRIESDLEEGTAATVAKMRRRGC
jgi:rhodanese-related sulfurtransferase